MEIIKAWNDSNFDEYGFFLLNARRNNEKIIQWLRNFDKKIDGFSSFWKCLHKRSMDLTSGTSKICFHFSFHRFFRFYFLYVAKPYWRSGVIRYIENIQFIGIFGSYFRFIWNYQSVLDDDNKQSGKLNQVHVCVCLWVCKKIKISDNFKKNVYTVASWKS